MSVHVIPGTAKEQGWSLGPFGSDLQNTRRHGIAERARLLCVAFLRAPESIGDDGTSMTLTFTPDLSAGEQTTLARLARVASSSVEITPAEWQAIESDVDGLQTFQGLPSPTLAQTVLAVKAQSRILKALLRS